jgi:AraC family transcriptional regulator, exoenzyme S synthesis regulatory protein ExsA
MINYYQTLKADPQNFKQFTFRELLFLHYDCPVEEEKSGIWSGHSYFIYATSGKKVWHTPNNSWALTAGNAIFVKPGACIVEQFFEDPFCVLGFFLPDSYIKNFVRENTALLPPAAKSSNSSELVIPVKTDAVMATFYNSVLPYFEMESAPPEKLVELKFRELLLNIITNPANVGIVNYMHTLAKSSITLKEVMENNFSYNLRLEEFALLCNRSLSSFKRDFMATFLTTPGRWLTERRLEYAHQLLKKGTLSIRDIAFECGFENSTHFSRIFKQKFGFSPMVCRKQVSIENT